MADTLPALGAPVSFVVEKSEAVGPIPMAEIVASIRTGERDAHSLVWWAGAPDWQFFDSNEELVALVDQSDAAISPKTEVFEPDASPATAEQPPSLTGLFSAVARQENGLSSKESVPNSGAVQAIVTARSILATAESREKAITQARHKTLAAALSGPAALGDDSLADGVTETALEDPTEVDEVDGSNGGHPIVDLASDEKLEPQEPERSKHEEHFDELVKKSEEHERRIKWATRVDEVLLRGCIAAIAERGYIAMDLSSRETEHQVLFESENDSRFVMFEIIPLAQVNAAGDAVGRHLEINMSWGQNVTDVDSAFAVVRSLASDEVAKPGKVRAEIDAASSRVFTTVDLIWAADDFVSADYDLDTDAIDDAVAAALHILERRWYKLFIRRR